MSKITSIAAAGTGDSLISDEQLSLLRDDFARLDTVKPGLVESILAYVVEGKGPEILDRLAATPGCGRALDLAGCSMVSGVNRAARARFFDNPPAADPQFFVRLAKVYDAAARPDRIVTPNHPSLGLPNWIEQFLWEATNSSPYLYSSVELKSPFRADVMEQVLVASGEPAGLLTRAVMMPAPKTGSVNALRRILCLQGFAEMAARYPAVIDEALGQSEADRRIHIMDLLLKREIDPSPFASRIVELAVCTQKTVRQAAEPLVGKVPTVALPFIRAKAENGTSDERALAAQVLWRIAGETVRDFLADRALKDPSAKVKEVIGSLLIESKPAGATLDDDDGPAPVAPVERVVPLSAQARTAFSELVHDAWQADSTRSQRFSQSNQAPPPLDETAISDGIDFIEGKKGVNSPDFARSVRKRLPPPGIAMWDSAGRLASRTDLLLIHVVRLVSLLQATDAHFPYLLKTLASHYYFSHKPRFSLRQLAATLEAAGHDPEDVRKAMFSGPQAPEGFLTFDAADVWPYFAERPEDLLLRWHQKEDYAFLDDRKREVIVKILAMFPSMPPPFSRLLWDVAFSGTKKMRPLAQAVLANEAGKEKRIMAALSSRNAEHRSIAAAWLASLGYNEAIPALKQALAKEKQEPTAGSIMVALESLGVPLDEFINTDGLLKEAQVLLAKGIPKELSSIDLDHLPRVRWAQSGKPVRQKVLQWMIVQSYKLKSPEPGPRLRQYASYFDRADAEEFGQHVLDSWIARDTIPHSPEQAHQAAEKFATEMAAFAQQFPQQFPGTKAEWYRQGYNQKLQEPVGSAQNEKGVLAVAGACCGRRAVPVIERYLKTYYGYRAHQCRALIRMLSWIDHPAAIQLLLSVSSRFRTAGIRKEAEACVNELAERKNWTIAELADRTIPSAGFDDALQLVLDFGSRTFTATLDDELRLVLRGEERKVLKTLPAPRKDDDPAKATAAKKSLSAAKKEVESVLKHQKERLYESMCTQRTWTFADWDQFLNKHPIMRHHCQRLIWCVTSEGKLQQTFRPLGDGTLTDAADHAVTVASDSRVCLAHESILPSEAITRWRQHLADYGVKPLFDQFGRGRFQLPEVRRAESTLDDFQGHLLEAFKLRGRLTKLGYTRGPTGDGGWFYSYDKRFPSVGITATIEFTGNGLPEENKTIALTSLHFNASIGGEDPTYANAQAKLRLGEVPPVLLSECWNDMRVAASDGPGFDPDWEKKTNS